MALKEENKRGKCYKLPINKLNDRYALDISEFRI